MANNNGHITFPVSIYDVQRAIGVSLNDLGRLCTHENINIFARYRPIPCMNAANNKNLPLSDAQRQSERYGIDPPIDMFTADDIQAYENYVNNQEFTENNGFYVHLRPWRDSHWKRLTDFVKTDNNGNGVAGKGYDHNAECDEVVITLGGKLYSITPLIPKGQRTIYLQDGEVLRFQFPNDHLWVDEYYKYVINPATSQIQNISQNDEWLSSLDFMAFNTYGTDVFATVMRSVIIFKRNAADTEWKYLNRVNDTIYPLSDAENRPYDTYKNAWLDLTRHGGINQYGDMDYSDTWQLNHPEYDTDENAGTNVAYFRADPIHRDISAHHDELLRNLEGRLLFLEIWRQSNSSTNLMPIQGLTYEVELHRTQAPIPPEVVHVYLVGIFTFMNADTEQAAITITADRDGIVFHCLINPSTFLNSGDVLYNGDSYAEANAQLIMTRLHKFYDSINLRVGTMTFNLFTDMIEVVARDYEYEPTWKECECLVYNGETIDPTGWTAEINAMIKQQMGSSVNGHDDLLITF